MCESGGDRVTGLRTFSRVAVALVVDCIVMYSSRIAMSSVGTRSDAAGGFDACLLPPGVAMIAVGERSALQTGVDKWSINVEESREKCLGRTTLGRSRKQGASDRSK